MENEFQLLDFLVPPTSILELLEDDEEFDFQLFLEERRLQKVYEPQVVFVISMFN